MELPEFLLARITEDEAAASLEVGRRDVILTGAFAPAFILAKCAADRRIVERHCEELHERSDDEFPGIPYDSLCAECVGEDYPCPTLRLLALPYADHPGYRVEWRP